MVEMQSKSDDAELELRLKTIKTNHMALKEVYKKESQRQRIIIYKVLFALIAIASIIYFAIMH